MNQIFEEIDVTELISFIKRRNKIYQRMSLEELELLLGKDHPDFIKVRKLFLDTFSDYTRSILKIVFGDDFEGKID